ncbi:HNH endonuclease [Desertihabitans aurantiacus]|uniref:HNH endonuclease n=1 Tax=Desertihabitans aurantiacus TaxID=2282477 RepID=UPI000DF793AB|nr:HNH endonuclease [Desertihabitans aurantiacus]
MDVAYEVALRTEAMRFLDSIGEDVGYEDVARFTFRGMRIPLLDYSRGIRKPSQLSAALSFRTVYTAPDKTPPYADQEGLDGLLRYKMRGDDPEQAENRALRAAMRAQLDLIWFVGVESGRYLPIYPVRLVAEETQDLQFVVALDREQRMILGAAHTEPLEDIRRWAQQVTQRRLHQPIFRARVLAAYQRRCAMCHLRHVNLLDASHILADRHELGQAVVPNGLSLCKIHHAAFDQHLIGVRPDLQIAVRRDVLVEIDGPMLRHGIQELDGLRLETPRERSARPDEARLEIRYNEFLSRIG